MVERFTEGARRIIFLARDEALQLGSPVVSTKHLGLAFLKEENSVLRRLLPLELIPMILQELMGLHTLDNLVAPSTNLPLSDSFKRALAYAGDVAETLNHSDIGPEHLLLGLLKQSKCSAVAILERHAITWNRVFCELGVTSPSAMHPLPRIQKSRGGSLIIRKQGRPPHSQIKWEDDAN
jgi:ATP-dependent Clp protease ATP-binding subunit ClpC